MAITSSPNPSPVRSPDAVLRSRETRPGSGRGQPHAGTDNLESPESRRSAGRPPEGQGFFNTLFHPFAPEKRKRRRAKNDACALVHLAMAQVYESRPDACRETLRKFVKHCQAADLRVDRELQRGAPSALHPVEEILRAGDYESLLVLEPALSATQYGAVFVNRSDTGFYIGEGFWDANAGDKAEFKARGQGIFKGEKERTQGAWSDGSPNGLVRYYPGEGPLYCYDGQVLQSKIHGAGRIIYRDGRELKGHWVNEVRDGAFVGTWREGHKLMGTWKAGFLLPGTTVDMADGRHFEGDINEETWLPEGRGSIVWQRGARQGGRYDGPIRDAEPQGNGRYVFGEDETLFGFMYEGPFDKGARHGVGTLLELATEKKQRCHFARDVLKSPMPMRTSGEFLQDATGEDFI